MLFEVDVVVLEMSGIGLEIRSFLIAKHCFKAENSMRIPQQRNDKLNDGTEFMCVSVASDRLNASLRAFTDQWYKCRTDGKIFT